jgi:hypothetical protein
VNWISYIPRKATLLLLFETAQTRLLAISENADSLSHARLASAIAEINQISDDIGDGKARGASARASKSAPLEVALPTLAASTATRSLNPDSHDEPLPVDQITCLNVSAEADGVQWAGECDLLAEGEKAAFVLQLVMLGYSPHEFRVTVRRVPPEGRDDTRKNYTVLVIQLRHGGLYRERRYNGGHGAEWINEFSRVALTDFPRNADPIRTSGDRQWSRAAAGG